MQIWRRHLGMVRTDPAQYSFSGVAERVAGAAGAEGGQGRKGGNLDWDADMTDPVCSEVYNDIVLDTAMRNTKLLESAFDGCAWNDCHTLEVARTQLGLGRGSVHVPITRSSSGTGVRSSNDSAFTNSGLWGASGSATSSGKDGEASARPTDLESDFVSYAQERARCKQQVRNTLVGVRGTLIVFPQSFLKDAQLEPSLALKMIGVLFKPHQ
jgi:hypothetical protein